MSETLVTVQITFPTVDRAAVADLTTPLYTAAAAAGGTRLSVSIQAIDEEEGDDDA